MMEQYKNRPNFVALITTFVTQIQNLENAIFSIDYGRSIAGAVGVQLDLLGTIVDEARNGLSDTEYRLFLLGKIGENSSNATADNVSQVLANLLGSNQVQEQDLYPAGVGLLGAGSLDPSLINLVYSLVQGSLAAGVRLEFLETYDPSQAFAFAGLYDDALGFGDYTDTSVGGMFAGLLLPNYPFAFASDDPYDGYLGFGSILDPVMGGNFQGL
jgi:hypothetical protein